MKLNLEQYYFKNRIPFAGRFPAEESNKIIYKIIDIIEIFEEREIISEFIHEGDRVVSVNFESVDKVLRGSIDFVSLRPFAGDSIVVTMRFFASDDHDLLEYEYLKKIFGNRQNFKIAVPEIEAR